MRIFAECSSLAFVDPRRSGGEISFNDLVFSVPL
jgi:hypothetical protein